MVQEIRRLDWDYGSRFTYACAVAKASSRLIMTVAASLNLHLATRDVTKAYFCTTQPLLLRVNVVPPFEASAGTGELRRLRLPL